MEEDFDVFMDNAVAWASGMQAYENGWLPNRNPHPTTSSKHMAWGVGYWHAHWLKVERG